MKQITIILFDVPMVATYFYTNTSFYTNTLEIGSVRIEGIGYNIKPILSAISLVRILSAIEDKERTSNG